MRLIPINSLCGGEIIAKDVIDETGNRLLAKDTSFKSFYKQKLLGRGIEKVYICDELSEGIEAKDVISDQVRIESLASIKDMASLFQTTKKIDIERIQLSASEIVDDVLSNRELIYDIVDIKSKDSYTYYHCVNVSVLCVMLGIKLGANRDYLKKLAVGGLLHDFGKILLPDEILNKPEQLSHEELEIIRQHPLQGYQTLKEHPLLTPISKIMILMHHEHINGGGYPLGVSEEKIHEGARICAICDVFDAMTSKRVYKNAFSIVETLDEMEKMTKTQLDENIFKVFRSIISYYPTGTTVLLSNDTIGIIEKNSSKYVDQPVVRVIFDLKNRKEIFTQLDIAKSPTIKIERELITEEYINNPNILRAMKNK